VTEREINAIARDLRLDDRQRYALHETARRFASMSDAEVRREANTTATRLPDQLLGGAIHLLGTAVCEGRYMDSLSPAARSRYEENLPIVGRSGEPGYGDLNEEEAEAAGLAASYEAKGDKDPAARLRRAIAASRAERGED
jgi:hypothetical protein